MLVKEGTQNLGVRKKISTDKKQVQISNWVIDKSNVAFSKTNTDIYHRTSTLVRKYKCTLVKKEYFNRCCKSVW